MNIKYSSRKEITVSGETSVWVNGTINIML